MKARRTTISIIALLGVFVFLVAAPVNAKDDVETSKAKAGAPEAVETVKTTAQKGAMEIINVNEANLAAFTQIKGIGPETAQNIIKYRKEVGSFKTLEDLKKVKGIGEETFEQIKPFVTLR